MIGMRPDDASTPTLATYCDECGTSITEACDREQFDPPVCARCCRCDDCASDMCSEQHTPGTGVWGLAS